MHLISDFEIGSFARLVWLSAEAKEMWAPTVSKLASFVQELEILSVVLGHRICSWQTISDSSYLAKTTEWGGMGLVTLPVREVASFEGFAHRHEKPRKGEPKAICVVVSRDIKSCLEYKRAYELGDNIEQGRLLGFPECCSKFFDENWVKGFYDPMWQLAVNSVPEASGNRIRVPEVHIYSNPLLRYIGLRVGFHIPCSFSCAKTIESGKVRWALGEERDAGSMKVLNALLSMPMSWDVLHGIAVVKTPLFYVIVQSVPTTERFVVEVDGKFIPREA